MAFKRAMWHSGLTYYQVCKSCRTPVRYDDYSLDFRPWYADGFVYCPRCKAPLRHSENFAINEDGTPYYQNGMVGYAAPQNQAPAAPAAPPAPAAPAAPPAPVAPTAPTAEQPAADNGACGFCTNCGQQYARGTAHFCSNCGNKLD